LPGLDSLGLGSAGQTVGFSLRLHGRLFLLADDSVRLLAFDWVIFSIIFVLLLDRLLMNIHMPHRWQAALIIGPGSALFVSLYEVRLDQRRALGSIQQPHGAAHLPGT